ncbi:MAG: hypothetical protein K2H60_14255 [Muribaculaceae bacterium]|nr:hypothetical protein [Muribaculaceae bacterium]
MTEQVPKAISNLRLRKAFKDLAVDIMDCITRSDSDPVYVVDDDIEKISRFATKEEVEPGGFTAYNPHYIDLYLLAIDHKLLDSIPGGIADCALFSTAKFSFIEFKTHAEGRTLHSVEETYQGAINQIENTIRIFERHLVSVKIDFLEQVEVIPHIVVSPKFPRSSVMEQQYMVEFFDRNQLELSFEDFSYF